MLAKIFLKWTFFKPDLFFASCFRTLQHLLEQKQFGHFWRGGGVRISLSMTEPIIPIPFLSTPMQIKNKNFIHFPMLNIVQSPSAVFCWRDFWLRGIDFWFWLNKPKSDCMYHFPIDLEANEIPFNSKSIGKLKIHSIKLQLITEEQEVDFAIVMKVTPDTSSNEFL